MVKRVIQISTAFSKIIKIIENKRINNKTKIKKQQIM